MLLKSNIPLLEFIENNSKFPITNFQREKKGKKYELIYSILSNQFVKNESFNKNYLIRYETLEFINDYLEKIKDIPTSSFQNFELGQWTLTISKKNTFTTYIFIISIINDSKIINILSYNDKILKSWLGGIIEINQEIFTSVLYNIDEDGINESIKLMHLIPQLINLISFEKIYCKNDKSKNEQNSTFNTDLILIDMSFIREYVVPTNERREHFRRQLCGPGRTILKQVKVKKAIVKEYIRKGKNIRK